MFGQITAIRRRRRAQQWKAGNHPSGRPSEAARRSFSSSGRRACSCRWSCLADAWASASARQSGPGEAESDALRLPEPRFPWTLDPACGTVQASRQSVTLQNQELAMTDRKKLRGIALHPEATHPASRDLSTKPGQPKPRIPPPSKGAGRARLAEKAERRAFVDAAEEYYIEQGYDRPEAEILAEQLAEYRDESRRKGSILPARPSPEEARVLAEWGDQMFAEIERRESRRKG